MLARVEEVGDEFVFHFEKSAADAFRVRPDGTVDIKVDGEEPASEGAEPKVTRRKYTLEELLEGMTAENLHPEIDWGPPVGREFW